MSILTMNMSSYEIETTVFDETVKACADWNPALQLRTTDDSQPSLPPGMISVDPETFLNRMTAYQH